MRWINNFLNTSHQLRDKYFPDSYLYSDDLHSATGYLFLYDPDHNYLYKASHCRSFADCIEFYDDWGYGSGTKLDVFYRMCDRVLPLIIKNTRLMTANAGRYDICSEHMHPDHKKHILLYDLNFCCSAYGLFQGINYASPKGRERKLIQERKEKAQELAAELSKAKNRLALLNEAEQWVNDILVPGITIHHKVFGDGAILEASEQNIIIQFTGTEQKKLRKNLCIANGLIYVDNIDIQEGMQKYQDILKQDKQQIYSAVSRAEKELIPYTEYLE